MPHRGLSLVLAFALLLFSWAELVHASDLDAHQGGESCEFCLFTGALDHGTTPAAPSLLLPPVLHTAPLSPQAVFVLPKTWRHTLGQRGPPTLS